MSRYTEAVERGTQGMDAVSTGECPGCATCADAHAMTPEEHAAAWHACQIEGEASFSWRPCGICGTMLGGDRYVWHWIDPNDPGREINHESDACTDCVMYLANGDLPTAWRRSPSDAPEDSALVDAPAGRY